MDGSHGWRLGDRKSEAVLRVRSYSAKNDKLFHYDGNTSSFAMNVGSGSGELSQSECGFCSIYLIVKAVSAQQQYNTP